MKNYIKGDVIHFQLDNNPAHSGVGVFVEYHKQQGCLVVSLLGNCKEHSAGTNLIISADEIN